MNNQFHVYQTRHVFRDDDHIGKWDVPSQTVRLRPEFAACADEVKAYFMRTHGIPMKVLVGEEEFFQAAPLQEFPDDVKALMSPFLGDLTPEVVTWARENFTRQEFERRYNGRRAFNESNELEVASADAVERAYQADPEESEANEHPELGDDADEVISDPEPKKRGRKPKAQD